MEKTAKESKMKRDRNIKKRRKNNKSPNKDKHCDEFYIMINGKVYKFIMVY